MSFADLQREIAAETMAALSNAAVAERDGGRPSFLARLATRDRDAFDVATVGTHTLRYLAGVESPLIKGDEITIAGTRYRVIDRPQRLNAYELTADLAIV